MSPKFGSTLWVCFAAAMFASLVVGQPTADDLQGIKDSFERFQSRLNTVNEQLTGLASIDTFKSKWSRMDMSTCTQARDITRRMAAVADAALAELNRRGANFYNHHDQARFYQCFQGFQNILGDSPRGMFSEAARQYYYGSQAWNTGAMIGSIQSFIELYNTNWPSQACSSY